MNDKIFIVPTQCLQGQGVIMILENEGLKKGVDYFTTAQGNEASWEKLEPNIKEKLNDFFPTKKVTVEVDVSIDGIIDYAPYAEDRIFHEVKEYTFEIPKFASEKDIEPLRYEYNAPELQDELAKRIYNAVLESQGGDDIKVDSTIDAKLTYDALRTENGVSTDADITLENIRVKSIEDVEPKLDKEQIEVLGIEFKDDVGFENITSDNKETSIEKVADITNHKLTPVESAFDTACGERGIGRLLELNRNRNPEDKFDSNLIKAMINFELAVSGRMAQDVESKPDDEDAKCVRFVDNTERKINIPVEILKTYPGFENTPDSILPFKSEYIHPKIVGDIRPDGSLEIYHAYIQVDFVSDGHPKFTKEGQRISLSLENLKGNFSEKKLETINNVLENKTFVEKIWEEEKTYRFPMESIHNIDEPENVEKNDKKVLEKNEDSSDNIEDDNSFFSDIE